MPEAARVLVVEDDRSLGDLLRDELESEGHRVRLATSVEEARERLEEEPADLVVSDLRLPGEEGTALLDETRKLRPTPPAFIVITAFGTVRQAVEALRRGADDFLTKPLDLDHLRVSASRALENRNLRREVERFRKAMSEDDFHGMIGRSPPMRRLFRHVAQVAGGEGPVLITGESGTGKELVARAVHEESDRSDSRFIPVNCAGIPGSLLESEFFGHAEGAFTGATSSRRGLFLEADGGTILLDEIGEMPSDLQAKLLRVLQEGRVRPVGSDRELPVDVRVLASTNQDLTVALEAGEFRNDLYYRLETFRLHVPPLRERGDDIERLAMHFLQRFSARLGRDVRSISRRARSLLRRYPFPGNVREMENLMERAVTYCEGSEVRVEHLPPRLQDGEAGARAEAWRRTGSQADGQGGSAPPILGGDELPPLQEVERRYILHALKQLNGNKRRTAGVLGIGRRTLYRRLEEYEKDEDGEADGI